MDYLDLIRQKKEVLKQLRGLDARQFGATSIGEMSAIAEERTSLLAALEERVRLSREKKGGRRNRRRPSKV